MESGGPPLPHGTKITDGAVTCASQTDGVTCLDGNGHGFRLAGTHLAVSPAGAGRGTVFAAQGGDPTEPDGVHGSRRWSSSTPAPPSGPGCC